MICWIDIETTGLNNYFCSIIELACVVTDDSFNEVARYETLIRPQRNCQWDQTAYDMHKKSGLLAAARKAPVGGIPRVDRELGRLLSGIHTNGKFEKLVLAGSSVHFDRGFIERNFKSAKYLHYRNFDVSSLKLFMQYAYGVDSEDLPGRKSESKHRAMDDINVSIEAAKWYKRNLTYLPRVELT